MDLGVHLPLIEFGREGQSLARLQATVAAAREGGFAALSANDHFVFSTAWLDGPTALAAVVERSGELELADREPDGDRGGFAASVMIGHAMVVDGGQTVSA